MTNSMKYFLMALLISVLTACGGSGSNVFNDSTSGTTTGTGTGAGNISIGSCASPLNEGVLAIGLSPLSAGGTTSVQANLVLNGECTTPYTTPVEINFSSTCTGLNRATLSSPVTTNNGAAISTYTAQGCDGTDTITATATLDTDTDPEVTNNVTLTATGTIEVLPATIGSIQFISATPTTIVLKNSGGTGRSETSTVIFKVLDNGGNPAPYIDVDFALTTTVGGITLSSASGATNSAGTVQTTVNAGNVHTVVRVTATVAGSSPPISTQSDELTITTGIPDQDSFTLTPASSNTAGCNDLTPTTVVFTAALADRFNNPVPDGTAVAFYAEGGSIDGSCTTTDGKCNVTWTHQNPVPADCVVSIMAAAQGEESFTDANANGIFDEGETYAFSDIGEAYNDENENGVYNSPEWFVDFDVDGVYDAADGKFTSPFCDTANASCNRTALHVFGQATITLP